MGRITDFLEEDQATNQDSQNVVIDGILECQNDHAAVIQSKYDRIKKAAEDKIEAERQNELRKKKRRQAREKRAKDQALEKFKDEVDMQVIMKAEIVTCLQTNLVDINGHYSRENFQSAPGGQLMQIYLILEEFMNRYPQGLKNYMEKKIQNDDEDYFVKPNNLRELLLPEHLMPFLMQYLKDMKNDSIEMLIHQDCIDFLNVLEITTEDLSTLTDEDLVKFKEIFNSKRMSQFHQGTGKMMDTLYDYLIDILAKRVPVEGTNVKVEQIMSKIKLIPIPEDVILQDSVVKEKVTNEDGVEEEKEVEKQKNVIDGGVIILTVPQVEEEQEITIDITQGTSEEAPKTETEEGGEKPKPKTKTVVVMVDVDQ